jgi:radical SAM protein with 4Fe4S-binding SPASM domain
MSGRYAKLKKHWLLRGWTDVPCAVVNWTSGDCRALKSHGAYTAQACDGETDFTSIAFLPIHNALLDKMVAQGIAQECERGDSIAPYQQYRKAENPRLGGLHWSVTGLCNLNCRHCYMEAPSGRYGGLSFEESLRLIEQFEQANVQDVSLTGGEPFLRKDLRRIIEVLANKKIRVSQIYTNGLLITEEILQGIKKAGFSPEFQISFDGVGAHEYMRGKKGIEQGVIEGIRKVRAAGFTVAIATSVDSVSKDSLADTYDLLKGLDIQSWRIAPPQRTGNWRGTTTDLSFEEEAKVYEPLLLRWLDDGKPFDIQLGGFFRGAGRNGPAPQEEPKIRHTPDSYDCGSCREMPYLLPDGTLLPCPGYTGTVLQDRMPNILRDGLSKAWSRSFLRSVADMRKSDLLARNEECGRCEWFAECGLGCRASALVETGDLMAKDPSSCELWKKGYRKRFQELAGRRA